MATVTMTGAKPKDPDQDSPRQVNCAVVAGLSIGDVVVVDGSDDATLLDVSTYAGDGSDIHICLSAAAQNDAVIVAEQGTDLTGITLVEGDVLYAKGSGLVGNAWTDVTTGDDVIILGFYAVGGIFRFSLTFLGYEKT